MNSLLNGIDALTEYAVILLDTRGLVSLWNAGAERIKQYRADEIVGKSFSLFYLPDDISRGLPEQLLATALSNGQAINEGWRVRKDGSRLWARVTVTPTFDESHHHTGFMKVTKDLTAEHSMMELYRSVQRGVDSIQEYAIYLLDPTGLIRTWNKGAERIKGYSAEEIIGRSFTCFFLPEAVEAKLPQTLLSEAKLKGSVQSEDWRVRKDGTKFWAQITLTATFDDAGQHTGFVKVSHNLTEKRMKDRHIEYLQRGIDALSDYSVILLDTSGRISSWSHGATRITGFEELEVLGKYYGLLIPPAGSIEPDSGLPISPPPFSAPDQRLTEARVRGRYEDENWRITKAGTLFWANSVLSPIFDEQGLLVSFVEITRDLSVQRRSQALENSRARMTKYIDMFTHGLRNPLMGIVGSNNFVRKNIEDMKTLLTQHLQAASPSESKTVSERLLTLVQDTLEQSEAISACADHSTIITNDVLDLSKLEANARKLIIEPFQIQTLASDVERMFRSPVREKGLRFVVECPSEPLVVRGDVHALEQVLTNLVTNAVKFTDSGQITLSISIQSSNPSEVVLLFQVRDTGIGMSEHDRVRLFNRFEQTSAWVSHKYGGSGLGLYISKQLVDLMGGSIDLKSAPGKGSVIEFTARCIPLPTIRAASTADSAMTDTRMSPRSSGRERSSSDVQMADATPFSPPKPVLPPPKATPASTAATIGHPATSAPKQILVVEDNLINQKILVRYLTAKGFKHATATSGREAVSKWRAGQFDLIFMDIEMPEMTGLEATLAIRREEASNGRAAVSIVGLSGNARPEQRAAGIMAGMNDYLTKPCSPEAVYQAIERWTTDPQPR